MTNATDEQVYDALERAIIGLSSGLASTPKDSESYVQLKTKIEQLFEEWRILDKKLNPCNTRIND